MIDDLLKELYISRYLYITSNHSKFDSRMMTMMMMRMMTMMMMMRMTMMMMIMMMITMMMIMMVMMVIFGGLPYPPLAIGKDPNTS